MKSRQLYHFTMLSASALQTVTNNYVCGCPSHAPELTGLNQRKLQTDVVLSGYHVPEGVSDVHTF